MRVQHRRCSRVGFPRDRHPSHDRAMRDAARPCSAKIKRRLPGRRWHRRRRSKLRFVLNERGWRAGRKRREDRNDRGERDEWAHQWPRPDPDHGCKTMTTDDVPTAYRHTPPPTLLNPSADRGRTAAVIGRGEGRPRYCRGVMLLPHPCNPPKTGSASTCSRLIGRYLIAPRRPNASEAECAKPWVIVRTTSKRPAIFAFALGDRSIVDAGDAAAHQAMFVEFPVLVTVAAKPIAAVIAPLISKAHGN